VLLRIDLANALREQCKHEKVVAELREALNRDPELSVAPNVWGLSLYGWGRYPAAAEEFREAVTLAPDDAVMQANLADVLRHSRKPDEAQGAASDALKANPESAWAHKVQGDLLRDQREYEKAEIYYRAAAGLAPGDSGMRANLDWVTQRRSGGGQQASVDGRQDRPPRCQEKHERQP
jgi:tetratricopeptide (TPR) repeat protein